MLKCNVDMYKATKERRKAIYLASVVSVARFL